MSRLIPSRLIPTIVAAAAIMLAAPVSAQMHEGSRGGGGGGGFRGTAGGGQIGGGRIDGGRIDGGATRPVDGGATRVSGGDIRGGAASGVRSQANQREFHGRAFSSLNADERGHWASGEWRHVLHDGVYGWWWFLDDDWFFYPDAVYPYPGYIAPLLTAQETPDAAPAQPYWYYCANPVGYYPYVPSCPIGWQTVPAAPADAPANAPPPPPPPGR